VNESDIPKEVGKAVLIAALSAAAVKLVEWGVEELRQKVWDVRKTEEKK
jgi:hypothetical protein